jgi:hypothetical protein
MSALPGAVRDKIQRSTPLSCIGDLAGNVKAGVEQGDDRQKEDHEPFQERRYGGHRLVLLVAVILGDPGIRVKN